MLISRPYLPSQTALRPPRASATNCREQNAVVTEPFPLPRREASSLPVLHRKCQQSLKPKSQLMESINTSNLLESEANLQLSQQKKYMSKMLPEPDGLHPNVLKTAKKRQFKECVSEAQRLISTGGTKPPTSTNTKTQNQQSVELKVDQGGVSNLVPTLPSSAGNLADLPSVHDSGEVEPKKRKKRPDIFS